MRCSRAAHGSRARVGQHRQHHQKTENALGGDATVVDPEPVSRKLTPPKTSPLIFNPNLGGPYRAKSRRPCGIAASPLSSKKDVDMISPRLGARASQSTLHSDRSLVVLLHERDPLREFVPQHRADLVLDLLIAGRLLTGQRSGEFRGVGLAQFDLVLIDG